MNPCRLSTRINSGRRTSPWTWKIYRGVTHEFIKMGRAAREARQAHAGAARALARALEAPDP